uniref:Uncharacterized protein n=1 Tax=Ditylenchus dipsaci TaxID=166011 RepID=A0A915DMV5_9BILA
MDVLLREMELHRQSMFKSNGANDDNGSESYASDEQQQVMDVCMQEQEKGNTDQQKPGSDEPCSVEEDKLVNWMPTLLPPCSHFLEMDFLPRVPVPVYESSRFWIAYRLPNTPNLLTPLIPMMRMHPTMHRKTTSYYYLTILIHQFAPLLRPLRLEMRPQGPIPLVIFGPEVLAEKNPILCGSFLVIFVILMVWVGCIVFTVRGQGMIEVQTT